MWVCRSSVRWEPIDWAYAVGVIDFRLTPGVNVSKPYSSTAACSQNPKTAHARRSPTIALIFVCRLWGQWFRVSAVNKTKMEKRPNQWGKSRNRSRDPASSPPNWLVALHRTIGSRSCSMSLHSRVWKAANCWRTSKLFICYEFNGIDLSNCDPDESFAEITGNRCGTQTFDVR